MSLVAHYKMNDCELSTEIKNSVASPHAVAMRNTNLTAVAGKVGRAQSFNGTSDYVDTGQTFQDVFRNSFSIGLWVFIRDGNPPTAKDMFGAAVQSGNSKVVLDYNSVGALTFRYSSLVDINVNSADGTFRNGEDIWQFIVCTVSNLSPGVNCKLYVNGDEVDSETHPTANMSAFTSAINLFVGNTNVLGSPLAGCFTYGDIDNIMIFNHALSQTEISALYNSGSGTEIIASDPFSYFHDKLWEVLEADSNFTDLVKIGNRIKFSGTNRSPEKDETITEDFPEVRIVVLNSTPHLYDSSNSCKMTKTFAIQVCSGDQRLDNIHWQLEWIIYRCMARNMLSLLALTWNSKKFITNVKPTSIRDSMAYDATLKPGVRGWISLWSIDVNMTFSTSDM